MNDLNVKINDDISEDLLNMKLTDMFCKHVIRCNPDGIQIKAGKLYIESCKLGYKVCNWGLHVGHLVCVPCGIRIFVSGLSIFQNE